MKLHATLASDWRPKLGWLAFVVWLLWRTFTASDGVPLRTDALSGPLVFFYLDASGVALALALFLWSRDGLGAAGGWLATGSLAAMLAAQLFLAATDRYLGGDARAWDLANYVQPLWRAAHGLSMDSATYDGHPVWADHGAFAMFAFAPWTRLTSSAAMGLFVVQSALVAACTVTAYGLGRALALPPWVALAAAALLGSSRALAQAARFDFHPECALPLLVLGIAWAHARRRLGWAIALSFLACSLRDVAAMTIAMLWLYWAVSRRALAPLIVAAGCAAVATVDVLWLPAWTGWQSYIAMHGSSSFRAAEAVATTVLRCLSTFALGWLHPIAWFAGAPWAVAAAVSPKLIVKGIDYQYGFMFAPVATLGALFMLAELGRRASPWRRHAALVWAVSAVAVNAPLASSVSSVRGKTQRLDAIRAELQELVPSTASVAADPCAAPYLLEREQLTLLCRLDGKLLQVHGLERWEEPVSHALRASHLVVRTDCDANGPCSRAQLDRAQRAFGFALLGRAGPFAVLRRRLDEP